MLRKGIRQCARQLADVRGTTCKEAEEFIKDFLKIIVKNVSEDTGVAFKGYFTFTPYVSRARKIMNPATCERVVIPARNAVRVRFGDIFREAIRIK